MLGLFLSMWLAAAPASAPSAPPAPLVSAPVSAASQLQQAQSTEAPIVSEPVGAVSQLQPAPSTEAPIDAPAPTPRPARLTKAERLVIAGSITYGVGAGIQWLTLGASGSLTSGRLGSESGEVLGMTLGAMGLVQGTVITGIGAGALGRERAHSVGPRTLGSLRAGGASLAVLGGVAMASTVMLWPTLRERCPAGTACTFGTLQLGGAALGAGLGMLAYAEGARRRQPGYHRLDKRARTPLLAGGALLASSYFLSATAGMLMWQEDPRDPRAIRVRNHLLIPVVGPWIYAAGPDSPLLMAMLTGGLGALQIGGTIALAVGTARASRQRARERSRVELSIAPRLDGGLTLSGRF